MVNYQLGKIYKIVDNTNGNVYVGSTCEPTLARRLAKHVADYKRYLKTSKNYITSFIILENNDYEITLIELYACNSKDELHAREKYFIESLQCVNKILPIRILDDDDTGCTVSFELVLETVKLENALLNRLFATGCCDDVTPADTAATITFGVSAETTLTDVVGDCKSV